MDFYFSYFYFLSLIIFLRIVRSGSRSPNGPFVACRVEVDLEEERGIVEMVSLVTPVAKAAE